MMYRCVLFLIYLYLDNVCCINAKMDPVAFKDSWIPKFSEKLLSFSETVLAREKIQTDITRHRKSNVIETLDKDPFSNEVFRSMCEKIDMRFTDVLASAMAIKTTAESKIPGKQLGPMHRCCKSGPKPGLLYDGRLRQTVNLENSCIGARNGSTIPKIDGNKFSTVFKENYDKYPSVLWQYYASTDGDFIEFPDSNNHQCDKNGNTISPLTEDWFAETMTKAEKNIVVVFDIGSSTADLKTPNGRPFNELIIESVKETLRTLTPMDKINVVAFNNKANTPSSCNDGLFIADGKNKDIITEFLKTINKPSGISDYSVGLKEAYRLMQREVSNTKNKGFETLDIVMLITDGQSTQTNITELFTMIDENQEKLGRKIVHLVYSPPVADNDTEKILTAIAEQNVPGWPNGFVIPSIKSGIRHGAKGFAHFISDLRNFPFEIATRFTSGIPQTTNTDRSYSILAPVIDDDLGLKMTISVPVIEKAKNNSIIGTAAVDVSLATMFTEIEDFILGVHSYAFLIEKRHGHVLLHPKLKDPATIKPNMEKETTFPALFTLEPDLSRDQINKLTNDKSEIGDFPAKMMPGRSTFMAKTTEPLQDATVFYKTLTGTQFVIVMIMFDSDAAYPKFNPPPPGIQISNVPYHRIDITHSFPICSIDGHTVAPTVTTVKLASSVFENSEVYKFTEETNNHVAQISDFLKGNKSVNFIKTDVKEEIVHSLIETQHLTKYWMETQKIVIERFLGSSTGVFRMYPGVALSNTFDHVQYEWYKKSAARNNDLVLSTGKISEFTPKDVVILTRTIVLDDKDIVDHGIANFRGVVGATITHRRLTVMMLNAIADCSGKGLECHILDDQGFFFTHGTNDVNGKYTSHLTNKFPWLASELIRKNILQPEWCTSMSEGTHELSYSFHLPPGGDFTVNNGPCKNFMMGAINGTNLFLLTVNDQISNGCPNTQTCQSCGPTYSKCQQCIGATQTVCQCPCYCDADFDQCSSQFNDFNATDFPHKACYYAPLQRDLTENKHPGPIKTCEQPCQAIEDEPTCISLSHCTWNTTHTAPLCVYNTITTTIGVPTKKVPFGIPTKKPSIGIPTKNVTIGNPTKIPSMGMSTKKIPFTPPRPTKLLTQKIPNVPTKLATQNISNLPTKLPTKNINSTTNNPATSLPKTQKRDSHNNVGLIVGLILVVLVLIALIVFIVFRLYGKKIQKALGNTKAGKYVRRNSVVDRVIFSRVDEEVSIAKAPNGTSIPYGQMG